MKKSDLVKSVSLSVGVDRNTCDKVIDAFIEELQHTLKLGEKIILQKFITLEPLERTARKGRNPQTGEVETFKPSRYVKCKFSRMFKEMMNE